MVKTPTSFYKDQRGRFHGHEQKGSGVGVIARDEVGRLLFTAAKKVQDARNAEVVEAESVIRGLELGLERGFPNVWFDCDSQSLIRKLR